MGEQRIKQLAHFFSGSHTCPDQVSAIDRAVFIDGILLEEYTGYSNYVSDLPDGMVSGQVRQKAAGAGIFHGPAADNRI